MSLNPPQTLPEIQPSVKQNWTDLNVDGRRMNRIIRNCMTEFTKKENSPDMKLAYVDRLIKATETKHRLAVTVLGVKSVLAEATKR